MKRLWLAELSSEHALIGAARELKEQGFGPLELYSPFPLEGAHEVLRLRRSWIPLLSLVLGLSGAAAAYLIQWYCDAYDWPLIVGSRPTHAAPAFVPITFETGILCAAAAAFFGALWGSGLPHLSHPVFDVEAFRSTTQGGFWLSVETETDAEHARVKQALDAMGVARSSEVRGPT